MRKIALLSGLVLASAACTTAADAKHTHHTRAYYRALAAQNRAPMPESLTTVGTPDCHVQGRLLRIAHHCPPEAVTAAPQ